MSVLCMYVSCILSPPHAIFFEASCWPSDHMISSRPLIGQPSFPPTPTPMYHCLPNVIETKKTRQNLFHLTWATVRGKEAKMESGHTFLHLFFLTLPYIVYGCPPEETV